MHQEVAPRIMRRCSIQRGIGDSKKHVRLPRTRSIAGKPTTKNPGNNFDVWLVWEGYKRVIIQRTLTLCLLRELPFPLQELQHRFEDHDLIADRDLAHLDHQG
jgi:hypothetical protein